MGQEKDIVSVEVDEIHVVTIPTESVVAVTNEDVSSVTVEVEKHVSSEDQVTSVVTVGQVGPRGPVGPTGPAGSTTVSVQAGTNLSDKRWVTTDNAGEAILADASNFTHVHTLLGLVRGATPAGDPASIQLTGEVEEPTWSWTVGLPLYLVGLGQMSQTAPISGFVLQVATPISPTRIAISIKMAISLV